MQQSAATAHIATKIATLWLSQGISISVIAQSRLTDCDMAAARRLRLVRKQPDPFASHNQAIADEGWSELVALSADARRKHIHWTHVKTDDPSHVQPHQISRPELWEHLERVYKEVYPEPANRTGSILLFGMVVKEWHAETSFVTSTTMPPRTARSSTDGIALRKCRWRSTISSCMRHATMATHPCTSMPASRRRRSLCPSLTQNHS